MSLTKKQRVMLDFIEGFIRDHGYSPTLREIMCALDYRSVSTVAQHINNLISLGFLRKRDGAVRSLELIQNTTPNSHTDWIWLEQEIIKRSHAADEQTLYEKQILEQALAILKRH